MRTSLGHAGLLRIGKFTMQISQLLWTGHFLVIDIGIIPLEAVEVFTSRL